MTFLTTNKLIDTSPAKEAGVTLMLAVLILSAITAIAFSLAAIVVIEIRNAGDNLRTEPALYATLGVTEEALMQYRRSIPPDWFDVTNCPSPTNDSRNICKINNVRLTPTALTEDVTPRIQTVRPNETVVIPLYLPQDFPPQPLYSRFNFTVLQTRTNGVVNITVRQTTVNNIVNDTSFPLSESLSFGYFDNFAPYSQYEIILSNPSTLSNPVTVSIETIGGDGNPKGIPFIDQQVLRVLSDYLGLTRTYLVRIPKF